MKRATLSAYPPSPSTPPPDLTDRLLARDAAPADPAEPPKPRRRGRPSAQPVDREPLAGAAPPAIPAVPPAEPPDHLAAALAAADLAADALRQAGRAAPARYDVALRYRLDALAHHLQQVKEFVASLAAR